MDMLSTLLHIVLALFGVDLGGSTYSHRASTDGIDTLYSIATVESGIARFECLASASGRCVYTVFPGPCAGAPALVGMRFGRCHHATPLRFALASGSEREVPGLAVASVCVRVDEVRVSRGCAPLEPIAGL